MKRSLLIPIITIIFLLSLPVAAMADPPGVGEMFPDFTMNTPEGESFSLGNHINQGMYILIDFWAYWCGPCKSEMPNVVKTWEEYGGKEFMIVGVSLDNPSTEEKMLEYIEEAGMTFPIVTELGGWQSPFSSGLGIRYIPQNFLLGSDGTVIFRDLRGEELYNTVTKLMDLGREYEPIIMDCIIEDDPRLGADWNKNPSDRGPLWRPFEPQVNVSPEELRLRFNIENPQTDRYSMTFWYKVYRPTGRKTHRVKDAVTGEVYIERSSGKPYIVYEVEVEEVEVEINSWNNDLYTGYVIPLGEDVWEVKWGLKIHSKWLDMDLEGADDAIDFGTYWTMTPEQIEAQGGLFFAEREE